MKNIEKTSYFTVFLKGPSLQHVTKLADFGAYLAPFWTILDHLRAMLSHVGAILDLFGAMLGHLGVILAKICKQIEFPCVFFNLSSPPPTPEPGQRNNGKQRFFFSHQGVLSI